MNTIEALNWRYATKKFDINKKLSKDKLDVLKLSFNLTATSYGLQPLKLLIINDEKLQNKLTSFSFNQKQVATASHVLVICIEDVIDKIFIEKYFKNVHSIRNTPKEILNPFADFLIKDFERKNQDEIHAWALNQAYLTLGTLLTVCAAEGIDACPMEGFEPLKYDEVLDLKKHNLKSVLVLPVGYRAADDEFSEFKKVRRPIEDMVIEL